MDRRAYGARVNGQEDPEAVHAFDLVSVEIQRIEYAPRQDGGPPVEVGAQRLFWFKRRDGMWPPDTDLDAFRAMGRADDVVCRIGLHVVVQTYREVKRTDCNPLANHPG